MIKGLLTYSIMRFIFLNFAYANYTESQVYQLNFSDHHIETLVLNKDNTVVSQIPSIGNCNGQAHENHPQIIIQYTGISENGFYCSGANMNLMIYSSSALGMLRSMELNDQQDYLARGSRFEEQEIVIIKRIK